ncbi:hypothetical protein SNEBB_009420, partial [Seison nebaliae]
MEIFDSSAFDTLNRRIRKVPPPCRTLPSKDVKDTTKQHIITRKNENIPQQLYENSICEKKITLPEVNIDTHEIAKNLIRGDMGNIEKLMTVFLSIKKPTAEERAKSFREKSRKKEDEIFKQHCERVKHCTTGSEYLNPKNTFVKQTAPAYSFGTKPNIAKKEETPGPCNYSVKREPRKNSKKGWSFIGQKMVEDDKDIHEYYNTGNYKALGTDSKHFSLAKRLEQIEDKAPKKKYYDPKEFPKRKITIGLKDKRNPIKNNAEFYSAVPTNTIKSRPPTYTLTHQRRPNKPSDLKASPADLKPTLYHKHTAPKFGIKFRPRKIGLDRFGDIVDNTDKIEERSPGPAYYKVNLNTNQMNSHRLTYRYNNTCAFERDL